MAVTHGSVVPWHVESSWARDGTLVPCIGRQILNHWTTMEVWHFLFKNKLITFRIPDGCDVLTDFETL